MEMPTVRTVLIDSGKNVRYEVVAYRELSQGETVMVVRNYLANAKKKPKKDSSVVIHTIIGDDTCF